MITMTKEEIQIIKKALEELARIYSERDTKRSEELFLKCLELKDKIS